ncbi:hypothetical protein PIB30_057317, partial [Stylosanthes scabra]|nr:hypothetical protein [Stylosanthes scabra]
MGFNRQSSERKWPERARGTEGSQQNLEGQSWSLYVRIKEAMRTHSVLGRHAYLAERTPMGTSALGPGDSRTDPVTAGTLKSSFSPGLLYHRLHCQLRQAQEVLYCGSVASQLVSQGCAK